MQYFLTLLSFIGMHCHAVLNGGSEEKVILEKRTWRKFDTQNTDTATTTTISKLQQQKRERENSTNYSLYIIIL